MTIQNTTIRKAGPSQGNGVTTVFPFTFKVFTATDILVTYLNTSGVESVLVLSTNYTVSLNADQNTSPGGSVTLLVAPATATYITLTSQVTNTQTLALTNSGGFYPESINNALDRTVIEIQQLAEQASRSITIPKSSTASPLLPSPTANNVLVWNNTATALINLPATAGTSLVDLAASTGSTLVGTTNGGTGSVTRTVASKLNDSFSFKDFGAVGNGIADDTAAVQAAVNAGARIISLSTDKFLCTSAITITNKSVEIIGGEFDFTSNNGFQFTSASASYAFILEDVVIISKSLASGAAISASWGAASNVNALQFNKVSIDGSSASNTWATGISVTNCTFPLLSGINIGNPAALANMAIGVLIAGTGVTSLIDSLTVTNATIGVKYTAPYNNTIQNSVFNVCNICIDYAFTPATYAAVISVDTCLFYPISYGIKGINVIALTVDKCFFQKQVAGTWVGIYLDQGVGTEIFESMITNNQFGNNLGTAPWTGIDVATGRVILIEGNTFDSGAGTSIYLSATSSENLVVHNTNAQANTFISNSSVTNRIQNNIDLQTYQLVLGSDVAVANPPNMDVFLGNSQNGYYEISNSSGSNVNVNCLYGGVYWQTVVVHIISANITLVNNVLTLGAKFDLQGGLSYTPPLGSRISFSAIPDGSGNIVWRETSPRNMVNGITGSVPNTTSVDIFTTAASRSFYNVYIHGVSNSTIYGTGLIYFNSAGTATVVSTAAVGMTISSSGVNRITMTNGGGAAQAFEWSIVRQK